MARLPALLLLLAAPAARAGVVVLDPGHGGIDDGAIGPAGVREADVALEVARRAARALEALGHRAVLTRAEDARVRLRARPLVAEAVGADAFVSIHCNAAPPGQERIATGLRTFSWSPAGDEGARRVEELENAVFAEEVDELGPEGAALLARLSLEGRLSASRALAARLQGAIVAELRARFGEDAVRDGGTGTAMLYVLGASPAPAALVELGFLTHPEEERRLRAPHWQQAAAEAIARALDAFLEEQR